MRDELIGYKLAGCCIFQVIPAFIALILVSLVKDNFQPNADGYRNLSGNW